MSPLLVLVPRFCQHPSRCFRAQAYKEATTCSRDKHYPIYLSKRFAVQIQGHDQSIGYTYRWHFQSPLWLARVKPFPMKAHQERHSYRDTLVHPEVNRGHYARQRSLLPWPPSSLMTAFTDVAHRGSDRSKRCSPYSNSPLKVYKNMSGRSLTQTRGESKLAPLLHG